jgi:hypothetical protein
VSKLERLREKLRSSDGAERRDALRVIASLGSNAKGALLHEVLALFDDTFIEGSWPTQYGPTGIDARHEFVVALAAVDAVASMGETAAKAIVERVRASYGSPAMFFAVIASGKMGLDELRPDLERLAEKKEIAYTNINFDQQNEFPIGEAAREAIALLDTKRARCSLPHTAMKRFASDAGPIASGTFRVVVDGDGRATTHYDFASRDDARTFADDAASETQEGPTWAVVLDDALVCIHHGKHYAT